MTRKLLVGLVVTALAIGITKLLLSMRSEEPAPGPAVSMDQLYPEAAEAALKAKARQSTP